MNVWRVLLEILKENHHLLENPLQLKGLLLDRFANTYKREIYLLLFLLNHGIVHKMMKSAYTFSFEKKTAFMLYERFGFAKEFTTQSLRIWAKVLYKLHSSEHNRDLSGIDPALEEAIRASIYKEKDAALSVEDLQSLVVLRGDHRGITNLAGVEKLVNLEHISLQNNEISDLTPLLFLNHLKTLFISNNRVQIGSVINEFENIQALDLSYNPIEDFDQLSDRTLMLMFDTIGEDISMKAKVYTLLTERGFQLDIMETEGGGD